MVENIESNLSIKDIVIIFHNNYEKINGMREFLIGIFEVNNGYGKNFISILKQNTTKKFDGENQKIAYFENSTMSKESVITITLVIGLIIFIVIGIFFWVK